jgi:hypothetical protein
VVEPGHDETDIWKNEQVHGGNVRRVVTLEGSPSLAGWPPSFDHVLGDARLLEQFAVMRGAPQSGFSTLISPVNTRSSASICGRPPTGRDIQRQ